MNTQELTKKSQALRKELQELEGMIAENKKSEFIFEPKDGESYYALDIGSIASRWENDGDELDKEVFSIGAAFPTEESAEAYRDLKKHIVDFPVKIGEGYWKYEFDQWNILSKFKAFQSHVFYYRQGFIMPNWSTKEDRKKRVELFTKAFIYSE